jgi:superfamily II DNA or RNA helicase
MKNNSPSQLHAPKLSSNSVITVKVGNSQSQVIGADAKTFAKLRNALSYTPTANKSYFSGKAYNQKRYLLDKRGVFPTGLLYLVKRTLRDLNLSSRVLESRVRPSPHPTPLFVVKLPCTPYPEQKAAAEACAHFGRGIVVAPTGVGKSLIVALIIARLQVRTLIVVPSLTLRHQLTESLRSIFGKSKVGRLGSPIAVENVDALDYNKGLKGYDCVVVDEFHHSGAATYQKLNKKAWGGVYYKFGLTATPFRSNENERLLLESVLSKVIFRVTYTTAVEKGYIVPVEAYYVDLPKQECKGDTWPAVYSELVVNNQHRNRILADMLRNLAGANISTLCLVKEIKHGKTLQVASGLPFANGEDGEARSRIETFNKGARGLIGTSGVLGEGVDTKPCEYVLLAGGGKSKNQFMQQVGRAVRRYPGKESAKVILFRDPSNKWLLTHFKEQVKFLKEEYGIVPTKLEI